MRYLLLFATLAQALLIHSQDPFPNLSGETATGASITLPVKGKGWTVIGLAYGQKAGPLLEDWYEPAYLRFIAKHGLMAGSYDADVY